MTSSLILFRYHAHYDVCLQNIAAMRRLNPDIPIHGLYGGTDALDNIPTALTNQFASNWIIPFDDAYYKWKNGDLCARWWFKDHGKDIPFDHAYFLEWDQLFFKSLPAVYGPLEKGANYGTIFGDFEHIKKTRWYWMREQYGYQTDQLIEHLAQKGMPVDMTQLSFSIMGGAVFCREFLERYSADPVPSYSNDEVRLSFYSAAFGIPFKDNGIKRKANKGHNIYVANNEVLTEKDVDHVIAQDGDIIHPLRIIILDLHKKLGLV